jgi:hypothetical protein
MKRNRSNPATPRPRVPEVVVEWLDARDWMHSGLPLDAIPGRVGLCRRYCKGWLVYIGPDRHGVPVHILASTYDPPETEDDVEEYADFTVIPSGWIRSIKYRTGRPRRPVSTMEVPSCPTSPLTGEKPSNAPASPTSAPTCASTT